MVIVKSLSINALSAPRRAEAPEIVGQGGELGFDVLTELWFEDEINLASFWERIREPEVAATIRADEANFLVAERTVIYRVDETES